LPEIWAPPRQMVLTEMVRYGQLAVHVGGKA